VGSVFGLGHAKALTGAKTCFRCCFDLLYSHIKLVVGVGIESLIRLSTYCSWCLEFGGDYGA